MASVRLRDLGLRIGTLPTGEKNSITDVPGVRVGHRTVTYDKPQVVRTGVTVVLPPPDSTGVVHYFAGTHAFNGFGEMTGTHWIEESGVLGSPIVCTSSFSLGVMRDALMQLRLSGIPAYEAIQPLVAETNDGLLNDGSARALDGADLRIAIENASDGVVAEGSVGGGTGMICHGFKAGIGTSSRVVPLPFGSYVVGALVQANYGRTEQLRVAGIPIGRLINNGSSACDSATADGSIIVVIATDAPLLPPQCKRLARRATVGLARVGGIGANGSGDLFIAFATGNRIDPGRFGPMDGLSMLPNSLMTPFFEAVCDAVEEAILNSLTAAETMTGHRGYTANALPLDMVKQLLRSSVGTRWTT